MGLQYRLGEDTQLVGFCDANWAGDLEDRKSTSGFLFKLGSSPIIWRCSKQSTISLSSTEAEYKCMSDSTKEVTWLRGLLGELRMLHSNKPIVIFYDNQSSVKLAKNPVFHTKTKHIEIHYHHVRDKVTSMIIDLQHVATTDQLADIFTKALGKTLFEKHRSNLSLVEIYSVIQN